MREILFRGKRIDDGKWIDGDLSRCVVVGETHIRRIEENLSTTTHRVDPKTVCQYTGLTDKNGRKIFEGDIVKGVAYSTDFVGYIVWIDAIAGFGVRYFNKHREPTAWENSSILKAIQRWKQPNEFQAEIIGNNFDNPELLKGDDTD